MIVTLFFFHFYKFFSLKASISHFLLVFGQEAKSCLLKADVAVPSTMLVKKRMFRKKQSIQIPRCLIENGFYQVLRLHFFIVSRYTVFTGDSFAPRQQNLDGAENFVFRLKGVSIIEHFENLACLTHGSQTYSDIILCPDLTFLACQSLTSKITCSTAHFFRILLKRRIFTFVPFVVVFQLAKFFTPYTARFQGLLVFSANEVKPFSHKDTSK